VNTVAWAKYSDAWFVDEIPCRYCPANFISKLPEEIKEYYIGLCRNCNILSNAELEERRKYHEL
jgi:hypothetical protein